MIMNIGRGLNIMLEAGDTNLIFFFFFFAYNGLSYDSSRVTGLILILILTVIESFLFLISYLDNSDQS